MESGVSCFTMSLFVHTMYTRLLYLIGFLYGPDFSFWRREGYDWVSLSVKFENIHTEC